MQVYHIWVFTFHSWKLLPSYTYSLWISTNITNKLLLINFTYKLYLAEMNHLEIPHSVQISA